MAAITYGQDSSQPLYKVTETAATALPVQGIGVTVDFSKFKSKVLVIAALEQIKAYITTAKFPL